MRVLIFPVLAVLLLSCSLNVPDEVTYEYATLPEKIDFNYHVKPILSDKCYTCHGPDDKARKANLRLDIESGFYKSLEDNPNHYVINKNSPEKSEILNRINSCLLYTSDAADE